MSPLRGLSSRTSAMGLTAHTIYTANSAFTREAEGFRLYLRTPQVDRAATSDSKP